MENNPISSKGSEIPARLYLLSRGITVFTLSILMFIAVFFSYPDIILSRVVLTSTPAPVVVYSEYSGYIDQIFVVDNELVQKGDPILAIRSYSDYAEVSKIKVFIKKLDSLSNADFFDIKFPICENLGELSAPYISLYKSYSRLTSEISNETYLVQSDILEREWQSTDQQNRTLSDNLVILKEELLVINDQYERKKTLYEEDIISTPEFEETKLLWLEKKREVSLVESQLARNTIRISQTKLELKKLINEDEFLIEGLELSLNQAVIAFKASLENWENKYVISAPTTGNIVKILPNYLNEFVDSNEALFSITPLLSETDIFAKCFIPVESFGKISMSAKVSILLDAYPYQEFGTLEAYITDISDVPVNFHKEEPFKYLAKINVEYPLSTSFNLEIPFRHELTGIARISTNERAFIKRIYDSLRGLMIEGYKGTATN